MLKAIAAVLQDLNLETENTPLRYCISISSGDTVSVGVFVDTRRFYQVKAAEFVAFEEEYDAHMRGWQQYGNLVPKPLGRQVRAGWDVFVTQGVQHKPFIFRNKGKGRTITKVIDDLSHFFRVSATAGETAHVANPHDAFLDKLEFYFESSPYSSVASHWIKQGRSLGVCGLPQLAQHGDFVANNLGYSGKQLVVFDWEDFGKYHLPGLDICSFCFSVAPGVEDLRALMTSGNSQNTALGTFVHRACAASGMDTDFFRGMIPLYLLCFLYVKRGYSPVVQSRIGTAVSQLSGSI